MIGLWQLALVSAAVGTEAYVMPMDSPIHILVVDSSFENVVPKAWTPRAAAEPEPSREWNPLVLGITIGLLAAVSGGGASSGPDQVAALLSTPKDGGGGAYSGGSTHQQAALDEMTAVIKHMSNGTRRGYGAKAPKEAMKPCPQTGGR
eukprot:CAMPEP_0170607102 /NCGR_PEP_ID=MMETSP0224-20130122/20873_1 /TAXON_ID=285029 /ORGANISM="Togula jolla, Strain CCCM 725" /LENGTH=147 /DNA_ID=CAMNT_0010932241 /DNA_START=43 /DNA_END=488 /DNA_ORIENTATION=-